MEATGDKWRAAAACCLGRRLETTVPLEDFTTSLERLLSVEPLKGTPLYHYPIVKFTETCLTFSSQVHFYPPLSDPFNPKVLKRISEILWLKPWVRTSLVLFLSTALVSYTDRTDKSIRFYEQNYRKIWNCKRELSNRTANFREDWSNRHFFGRPNRPTDDFSIGARNF